MIYPSLRVVSWNVNCGVFTLPTPLFGGDQLTESVDYIGRCLRSLAPDLVAFQEVRLPGEASEYSLAPLIAQRAALSFVETHVLSPAHQVPGANLGLAVLSRYPITVEGFIELPNPGITIARADGSTWESHDKGALITRIQAHRADITFVCVHLPPFHQFGRDPSEHVFEPIWRTLDDSMTTLLDRPLILCADFNAEPVAALLPGLIGNGGLTLLVRSPTRLGGARHDQIACSPHWASARIRVLPSRFDHHLCSAELLDRRPGKKPGSPAARPPTLSVLHLSESALRQR